MDQAGEKLTDERRQLIELICERFEPEESQADLGLLYEVTGYKGETEDDQFWEEFDDSHEIATLNL